MRWFFFFGILITKDLNNEKEGHKKTLNKVLSVEFPRYWKLEWSEDWFIAKQWQKKREALQQIVNEKKKQLYWLKRISSSRIEKYLSKYLAWQKAEGS